MADSVAGADQGARRGIDQWIDNELSALARRDPTRLTYDVFYSPSIGPVSAWLVGALIALVAWLTVHYAPGAAARAGACGAAASGEGETGIISVVTGYWTLGVVAALTLSAGMQPVLERRFSVDLAEPIADWYARQGMALRGPVALFGLLLKLLCYIPAALLSFADWLLARPGAYIAGAAWSPFWLRYGAFLFWIALTIAATWRLPAPLGLYGFAFGVALILAVVRRWNWVERDREAFFVSRRQDPENERIGFKEDLRDEALVALVCLFALIPLGLRQVALLHPDTFCVNGAATGDASVLAWLGFFGAEMAKSVPFVDWSEVFHVANGSPIEPNTVLGAQVVFAMRATLDLIMIAAVVQAVQLASRLAEQSQAFAAGKINILEPFGERTRFHALGVAIERAGEAKVIDQPRVAAFPAYSPERLVQIVEGGASRRAVQAPGDPTARRAALALAAKQAVRVGRPEEARPLIIRATGDPTEANRRLALRIQHELEPTAVMVAAYARANAAKAGGAAVDADALAQEFQEEARPLALRAIRSALGELDQMVPIPAGTFMIGAPEGEKGSSTGERPQHQVRLSAFETGKYPVTFEEFDAFCEATGYFRENAGADRPADGGWGRGKRPVINVNWHDAKAYITWLNSWSGGGCRLPSEAEWEYACRAGTTTRWSFGDDEGQLGEYAWFAGTSGKSKQMTHPVGEKRANAFGLHDMHGNVWEWCEDRWHETYEGAPQDGSAWIAGGDTSRRVLRGGDWYNDPVGLRSANRGGNDPSIRKLSVSFRLARSAPGG
jgi:formylglycine-generating enzyme required for sulfatase activity